jgi:predicted aspartyl protease
MNGEVDVSGRALIVLSIRPSHGAEAVSLQAWVDTAFTGELVIPRATITRLGLPQSAAVMAGLADGTQVVLDTFSCVIDWFGQERVVEVVNLAMGRYKGKETGESALLRWMFGSLASGGMRNWISAVSRTR